jgi:hypothetical protein
VLEGRNCFTEEDSESNNTNITKNMSVEFQSSFSTKSKQNFSSWTKNYAFLLRVLLENEATGGLHETPGCKQGKVTKGLALHPTANACFVVLMRM